MNAFDPQPHVTELFERGYTALPALYSQDECATMRDIMDGYWRSEGSPSLASSEFGFTIHPMLGRMPQMAEFLDRPEPIEVMRLALGEAPRLVHLGARISGPASVPRLPWHNHYEWDEAQLSTRSCIGRILCGVYIDGTLPASGPLIALPRRLNDPLGQPLGPRTDSWPGEQKVELPPGSVSIFDTALWHAAARGTGSAMRRLWGGHYQGWSNSLTHPEDNAVDVPEVAQYKREYPRFKAMLQRS